MIVVDTGMTKVPDGCHGCWYLLCDKSVSGIGVDIPPMCISVKMRPIGGWDADLNQKPVWCPLKEIPDDCITALMEDDGK